MSLTRYDLEEIEAGHLLRQPQQTAWSSSPYTLLRRSAISEIKADLTQCPGCTSNVSLTMKEARHLAQTRVSQSNTFQSQKPIYDRQGPPADMTRGNSLIDKRHISVQT